MADFPPNSFKSKDEEPPDGPNTEQPEKEIRQVAVGKQRKTPLGKKFRGMFFGGDARTAAGYVGSEVMVPLVRDLIYEAGSSLIGRIVFGDSFRQRRPYGGPPVAGPPPGYTQMTNYSQYSRMRGAPPVPVYEQPRMMSQQARAHHNFDEIILQTAAEADEVLRQLYELLSVYEVVSVADLYRSVAIQSTHVDHKWGWTDLRGSGVSRLRGGGYLLDLPEPRPIN